MARLWAVAVLCQYQIIRQSAGAPVALCEAELLEKPPEWRFASDGPLPYGAPSPAGARLRIGSAAAGLDLVVPNFFFDAVSDKNGTAHVAIPPRPGAARCGGIQAILALWRGGVTTLQSLQQDFLAPALRTVRVADHCRAGAPDTAPYEAPLDSALPPAAGVFVDDALQDAAPAVSGRAVFVALAQPNTRRELALAASSRGGPSTLATQGEFLFGIHAEPELFLAGTPVAYFLVMREPISRLVSDFANYRPTARRRREDDAAVLVDAAAGGIVGFGTTASNYALRFFGNDSHCEAPRSRCASLDDFDASMRSTGAPGRRRCHLDYDESARAALDCAFSKPRAALQQNLAYLKQNMHRLFAGVGVLERLPETLVLWHVASAHHDRSAWPLQPCVPPQPAGAPPESVAVSAGQIRQLRELNALDLDLYSAVQTAFQMQLVSARRHGGRDVFDLLRRAANGDLPQCKPP
ncbi:hypothetical protein M885DRAFT_614708 [Pelagophyceae sp. CCMP2097]|nr:hypothetical protein M885DRAFT_614708 [Pelagophyceae sp. CCMP2097]|mmetsp:Transcript_4005/g.14008  ORF Transcript_4005/g.14008 Transcript_4005/m.14008 type:complete len:466 (-) Transcript_4005:64-1461(-)